MNTADTPKPGEESEGQHNGGRDPTTELEIEANPQPEPDSSLPPDDESEVADTEQQPS